MTAPYQEWVPLDEIAANDPYPIDCPNCTHLAGPKDIYCATCGYPIRGGEAEQKRYRWRQESLQVDAVLAEKRVKQGRNVLFLTAMLSIASGLFLFKEDISYLISGIILAIVYVVLGFWSMRKPFAALLTGLVVYSILVGFDLITTPGNIGRGILLKIVVIVFLAKGISGTRELTHLRNALRTHHD